MNRRAWRKLVNRLAIGASVAAMAFGLAWLLSILWNVISLGVGELGWALFTQMTPSPALSMTCCCRHLRS